MLLRGIPSRHLSSAVVRDARCEMLGFLEAGYDAISPGKIRPVIQEKVVWILGLDQIWCWTRVPGKIGTDILRLVTERPAHDVEQRKPSFPQV